MTIEEENRRLREALELYADPLSWGGISMLTDPPCGDMADDFDETDIGLRPGKRARAALAASPSPAVPATTSEPTEGDVFDTTPSAGESKPVSRAGAQEPGVTRVGAVPKPALVSTAGSPAGPAEGRLSVEEARKVAERWLAREFPQTGGSEMVRDSLTQLITTDRARFRDALAARSPAETLDPGTVEACARVVETHFDQPAVLAARIRALVTP